MRNTSDLRTTKPHLLTDGNAGPAFDTKTIYGSIRRPPTLTRTERIRFVRAYYQLWMLTLTPQADLETRLQNITSIQQLYYLDELCLLNQSIGGEEQATPSQNAESFLKRTDLHSAVWDRLEEVCTAAHDGKEPESVTTYAFEDGYRSFVVLWDHWQDSLKQIVCGIRPGRPWTFDKEELWDDGADVDEALCEEC